MNSVCKCMVQKSLQTMALGVVATLMAFTGLAGPADAKYKEIEVKNGGTIKGVATWKGEIPKLPPLTVFKHMDKCGQTSFNPALIVDPASKGVKFVAIYLDGKIEEGKPLTAGKLDRDSSKTLHAGKDEKQRPESVLCNFEEHVFSFVRTQKVGLYNMEDLLHNPHGFSANGATIFNIALPDRNRLIQKKFKRVKGMTRFQCDTHVHMNAWMFGFAHPYFAVTDAQGKFEITEIPPGKYTVVGWHEGYNIKEFALDNRPVYDEPHIIKKEIEVKAGETVDLNLEYPVRDVKVEWKVAERKVEGH